VNSRRVSMIRSPPSLVSHSPAANACRTRSSMVRDSSIVNHPGSHILLATASGMGKTPTIVDVAASRAYPWLRHHAASRAPDDSRTARSAPPRRADRPPRVGRRPGGPHRPAPHHRPRADGAHGWLALRMVIEASDSSVLRVERLPTEVVLRAGTGPPPRGGHR